MTPDTDILGILHGQSLVTAALRAAFLGLTFAAASSCSAPPSGGVQPVSPAARGSRLPDSLLALMTPEEKIGQLIMAPAEWDQTGPRAAGGGDNQVREGRIGSFLNFWGAAATRRIQRVAVEESRLHIPLLFAYDVIHGWRTVFPVSLAEAASFDTVAVEGAARIAAVEASAHGVHWTFAPMVDIARDARWGRVVEGAGEDPFLGAGMAGARVRGFQGDDLADPTTIMATAKHFAAYGAAESGRDYNVADVSERTMWEVYLPPFEAAVRAGAGSLMAAFNEIGGTPAHASEWLLGDVLRGRWGFRGLVVSDWTGVEELLRHGIAADRAEAAARALTAGVDVEMSSTTYTDLLPAARAGTFPVAEIDSAVLRVLRAKQALGLFDDPYRYSDTLRERRVTLTAEHRAAARGLARKAIVLLKNDRSGASPTLPLRKDLGSIAVIGPLADDARSALGSWSGAGKPEDAITLLEGIRRALPSARVLHARGAPVDTVDTSGFGEAERIAREADAVLLVLGERENMSGEAASRTSIELPGSQQALAQAVARAARASDPGKPVVAVLMNGRPLAIPWLADSVPAIVEAWFLGVEHGHAVADVLFGTHNPAGRLPVSLPRVTGQVPIYYSQKPTGRPPVATEKYTSKYLDVPWTPQWPFGHGLSYTTFTYADLRLSADSIRAADSLVVTVSLRNSGARAGDEVVQLYLRDEAASVTRPLRSLKGFGRVSLEPGEAREVRFTLRPEDLSLYDLTMRRVVEPGAFRVFVGGSSEGGLEGRFLVVGDTLVLAPPPPRLR
jgi:beta-glucosidase